MLVYSRVAVATLKQLFLEIHPFADPPRLLLAEMHMYLLNYIVLIGLFISFYPILQDFTTR